ncbi:MAG: putative Ig domain-containing protein [Acidobacteria bacterium]|nr:putative Ig domain-containing protein [Acidobacteriota bacterium]
MTRPVFLLALVFIVFSQWVGDVSARPSAVLFREDFADGKLDPSWRYRGEWRESRGMLLGHRETERTGQAVAARFRGCAAGIHVAGDMKLAGDSQDGMRGSVSLLGWYASRGDYVELRMKDKANVWFLRQYVSGALKSKKQVKAQIEPNVTYHAEIDFDGANFYAFVNGQLMALMPKAGGSDPRGTTGFRTKRAFGYFDNLQVSTIDGPVITIGDVTVNEGDAGSSTANFTLTLSSASTIPVWLSYQTQDGTATSADYAPSSGALLIPAGQTDGTIGVTVFGDTVPEGDEVFYLNLGAPTNATIGDGQASCIVLNDDSLCLPTVISPSTLIDGATASAYGPVNFTQTGATDPVVWALVPGTLPAGMAFTPAGVLSGTPEETGTFPLTFQLTDANFCTASRAMSLTINCAASSMAPAVLPAGTNGIGYGPVSLTLVGAVNPVTWEILLGALPSGLSLSSDGTLSGIPTQAEVQEVTVRGTDAAGCMTSDVKVVIVNNQNVSVLPTTVPAGTSGNPYGPVSFSMPNGADPVTWTIQWGSLPTGLTLAADGTLSGTPTQTGVFVAVISATDSNGRSAAVQITLTVN